MAQERIELARFDRYWNAGAIHVGAINYTIIPDGTVRLANLRAGQLDLIERLSATDAKTVRSDGRVRLIEGASVGFQALSINVADGEKAKGPLADPRVRAATAVEARRPLYREAVAIYLRDRPVMFLYHVKWLWAASARLDGFAPVPDGLIRPQDIRLDR